MKPELWALIQYGFAVFARQSYEIPRKHCFEACSHLDPYSQISIYFFSYWFWSTKVCHSYARKLIFTPYETRPRTAHVAYSKYAFKGDL